jgi:hypothetical protein
MPGRNRNIRTVTAALAALLFAGLFSGCASPAVKQRKAWQTSMQQDLGALADKGDLGSMRLVADVEMLRAEGFFTDSLATALTKLPGATFFEYAASGEPVRKAEAANISALLEFTSSEPALLKDAVITTAEAAEVRRLAADNMSAAADMANEFKARGTPQ